MLQIRYEAHFIGIYLKFVFKIKFLKGLSVFALCSFKIYIFLNLHLLQVILYFKIFLMYSPVIW
jgi:hypothetical protein